MNIQTVKIADLVLNENNPRLIKDPAFKRLCESVKMDPEFLQARPVIASNRTGKNVVIAGNQRVRAAQSLGMETVPAIIETLSEEQEKRWALKDNMHAGEWDNELLKLFEEDLLAQAGFTERELAKLFSHTDEKDDDVPDIPAEPISKIGDLYLLGDHRLLCGDSCAQRDMERLMGGRKADMVFTDPPYNVNYSGRGENTSNTILNDKMDDNSFDAFLRQVFQRLSEHSKVTAGWYVFHSSSTQHQFQAAIAAVGWDIKAQIIWNKPVASMGWGDYHWKHEPMFYCGRENTAFYGDRTNTTVLDIPADEADAVKWLQRQKALEQKGYTTVWSMKRDPVGGYVHPTQKPVELIMRALRNSSMRGDLVLDVFGGSGSTIIAAEKTGRVCHSMELDPRYVDVIVNRWENFTGKKAVKSETNPKAATA